MFKRNNFVGVIVNQENNGYLYLRLSNDFVRLSIPADVGSRKVVFSNFNEMQADIDAMKKVQGVVFIGTLEHSPFNYQKLKNIIRVHEHLRFVEQENDKHLSEQKRRAVA